MTFLPSDNRRECILPLALLGSTEMSVKGVKFSFLCAIVCVLVFETALGAVESYRNLEDSVNWDNRIDRLSRHKYEEKFRITILIVKRRERKREKNQE